MIEQQRIAVGLRLGDFSRAQRSASAAHILDHDLLAKGLRHRIRNQPSHRIARPARRGRHDNGHGPFRIGLLRHCAVGCQPGHEQGSHS
jgi:hypothetical protein